MMPDNKQVQQALRRRRRSRKNKSMVGLTTTPCIFPPMFRGRLFYNTVIAYAPAAGTVATNVFRMNSVYDPDLTGTGASASGYGQLSALYGRYRVLSAKATIEIVNLSTATPLTVFAVVNPVTTVGINIAQILAQRFVWTTGLATVNGTGAVKHTLSAPISKVYGVPNSQVRTEDDFAAITGTNPNNGVYLHVGGYANGGSAGNFNAHIRIEYDVIWSLPLEMT